MRVGDGYARQNSAGRIGKIRPVVSGGLATGYCTSNSHFEHNVIPHRWLPVENGLPPPADTRKSRILDHLGPSAR